MASSAAPAAVRIEFDYRFDTADFFASEDRRAVLELAADAVSRWTDDLSPIVQGGTDTWSAWVNRPDTGVFESLPGTGFTVPADTLIVFVGTRNFAGASGVLAEANRGFSTTSGSATWSATVKHRGQSGSPAGDYGPWGGSIAFNHAIDWHDDVSSTGLEADQYDLLTVAVHELIHVLGFGVAESFSTLSLGGTFAGPSAMATGSSGNPSLALAGGGHWAAGTTSTLAGLDAASVMEANIPPGARRLMTDLDAAALEDIGWMKASPGDLDRNGAVDFEDAFTLINHYGSTSAGWSRGDTDGDLDVDFDDAFAVINNYGAFRGTTNSAELETFRNVLLVPEPAAASLFVAVAWRALIRPRRASQS